MNVKELATLVAQMRTAQRAYFRERSERALADSKRLESRVDRACTDVLQGQRDLFELTGD